jgi:hypothetical protein
MGAFILFLLPVWVGRWGAASIFLFSLTEEIIGRWSFYEHLHRRIL